MQQNYNPGLHILSTVQAQQEALTNMSDCKTFFTDTIAKLGLVQVGAVYHQFENGGFTAVICLTESHISIHTWPEHELATFDVFLSNYTRDNNETTRELYEETVKFLDGTETNKHEITR